MHIEDRSKPVGDSAGKQVNLNVNSKDSSVIIVEFKLLFACGKALEESTESDQSWQQRLWSEAND